MKGWAAVAVSDSGPRPRLLSRARLRQAPSPQPVAARPDAETVDLEPTIYRFIMRHSWPSQLALLLLTLASFPFLYLSLNLPKTIVNQAIRDGAKFPQSVLGFELDRVPYLMVL